MRDYLTAQIARRRTELDAMDRRRVIVDAELKLLDEMMRHLDVSDQGRQVIAATTIGPLEIAAHGDITAHKETVKPTHLYPKWACVLEAAVRRYPTPVTNNEVPSIQRAAGHDPANREGVRSHISTQAKAGRYEKLGRGSFRATKVVNPGLTILISRPQSWI
jgi:hypothetical protein